ncbi:pantoate--beta-alanine ligase [bacterium LRH843]|nr:pantoate--beta-alanine ligase [bacterium LRH843]
MKIVTTIKEARTEIERVKQEGHTIGFVPTMGYLHEGHISLIKEARKKHDFVVISIFVNPLQFGPNEDFDRYPRNIERDEQLAKDAGVDLIFYPSVAEMYPTETPPMMIHVSKGVDVLCGSSRPGHFDGVATVVMKLFQIVQPTESFFGQKDAQQVAILINMVETFNVPLKIVICPTVREKDGLAKSSRNVYLQKEEREEAPFLYKTLEYGASLIRTGDRNTSTIKNKMLASLEGGKGQIDYLEILHYPSLEKTNELSGQIILALAYHYKHARLIDNYIMRIEE